MPMRHCLTLLVLLFPFTRSASAADPVPLPKAPAGFRVELVLKAPDIESPTALAVAANGDVYFAEDPMDMRGPPTKNIDKIWLLKGGDPAKKILFADQMWAVMGIEVVRDKMYVVHPPYVSVFRLDSDGKAAGREDLFTDLGPPVAGVPSFNDHVPSGIRMGIDGWLYVSIGDKGIPKMTRKETNLGSVHVAEGRWRHSSEGHHISLEGGGVIRFRPDGSGLEVFASGTRNHLDVPLDEHDRVFVRDNTDDGLGWWTRLMFLPRGGFLGYPWAYTQRPKETMPMVRDFGGGAPCGGYVYCDDGLPETYKGRVFHCEWGQGKVYAVKLAADGAGFKFVDQIPFLDPTGTSVKDFRPFTIRPTADGRGFYVTDWGFSGWLSSTKAGRIFKVTYSNDDAKPALRGHESDDVAKLIAALDHPALAERVRAQRALAAKGDEAVDALVKAVEDGKSSARVKSHGLWALKQGGARPEKWQPAALRNLADGDAGVRIEAARLVGDALFLAKQSNSQSTATGLVEKIRDVASHDADAQVRLQAVIALRADDDLVHFLDHLEAETDRVVLHLLAQVSKENGLWTRLARSENQALAEERFGRSREAKREALFLGVTGVFDARVVAMLGGLAATGGDADLRKRAVAALARVYKDRKPYAGTWWGTQPAGGKPPARDVAWEGTPLVRNAVVAALGDADAGVRLAAVDALVQMKDPESLAPLVKLYGVEKNAATRLDLVRATAAIGTHQAGEFLVGVLRDHGNPLPLRLQALDGLAASSAAGTADALAQAVSKDEDEALQAQALRALGARKAAQTLGVCTTSLKETKSPVIAVAALKALAALGDAKAAPVVLPELRNANEEVRRSAIEAAAALHLKGAVPELLHLAAEPATEFEAVKALTATPDKRALSAYLIGLGSKSPDLRKAAVAALAAVRDDVAPLLEELGKRNELRAELIPGLRTVYQSAAPIVDWHVVGPFPDDGKPRPPEKEVRLDAVYKGVDKEVKWTAVRGDARNHGRVNLFDRMAPNEGVAAYGYAEINCDEARDATLFIGSDDTITVWLNGAKVHEFPGDRGWAFDADKVAVHLDKGKNRLLIKCGNHSGPWEFSVSATHNANQYAFLKSTVQKYDIEAFRAYARKNNGDAERGKKLFMDLKGLACIKCHAVGGEGGRVGPDLAGIAVKYPREELITSVLEPSKTIANGYDTIVVTTVKGVTLTGVFKGETADVVNLTDADGKAHSIPKKEIDERAFSPVSSMPSGLNDGLSLGDFADLIAYLEARREAGKPDKK